MDAKKIVVIGSTNMDMVVKAAHLPAPGETILGGQFFMNSGGKGANQAVAVARLGGNISFITKIGDDIFGKQSAELFDKEGIDTSHILIDDIAPSGVALINVDAEGENSIVVASGANAKLSPGDVGSALEELGEVDIILIQLETPIETVNFAANYARQKGILLILNPAPASTLPAGLIKNIGIITPNEKEAEMLTGIKVEDADSAAKAANVLHNQGVDKVIITLGSKGAFVSADGATALIPSIKVEAVDTTAAGDTFNGALAVALSEGQDIIDAIKFACQASSISVTRLGAQSSIPYRNELNLIKS